MLIYSCFYFSLHFFMSLVGRKKRKREEEDLMCLFTRNIWPQMEMSRVLCIWSWGQKADSGRSEREIKTIFFKTFKKWESSSIKEAFQGLRFGEQGAPNQIEEGAFYQ